MKFSKLCLRNKLTHNNLLFIGYTLEFYSSGISRKDVNVTFYSLELNINLLKLNYALPPPPPPPPPDRLW